MKNKQDMGNKQDIFHSHSLLKILFSLIFAFSLAAALAFAANIIAKAGDLYVGDYKVNLSSTGDVKATSLYVSNAYSTQATIGYGIYTPLSQLDVVNEGSGAIVRGITSSLHSNAATSPLIMGRKSRGTNAVPLRVNTNDNILGIWARPYNGSDYLWGGAIGFAVNSSNPVFDDRIPLDMVFTLNNGSSTIGLTTAGSERMRLKNNGYLGIGKSPNYMLDVNGNVNATNFYGNFMGNGSGLTGQLNNTYVPYTGATSIVNLGSKNLITTGTGEFNNGSSGFGAIVGHLIGDNSAGYFYSPNSETHIGYVSGGSDWAINAAGASYFDIITAGSLNVTSGAQISGNMGIGTGYPNQKLVVVGNVNITGNLSMKTGSKILLGSNSEIYDDGSNLYIITNASNSKGLAWFSTNISSPDYFERTQVYDGELPALKKIKDKSKYYNADGSVNHKAFDYSYVSYEVKDSVTGDLTTEDAVSLGKEIALLKQSVYELKIMICSDANHKKDEICVDACTQEPDLPFCK